MPRKFNETYAQFWRETIRFSTPRRFGYDWFCQAIQNVWDAASTAQVVDWSDYERMTRDILSSPNLTNDQRVELLKEAVGAFTGRGCVGNEMEIPR